MLSSRYNLLVKCHFREVKNRRLLKEKTSKIDYMRKQKMTMKAIQVYKPGEIDVLKQVQLDIPESKPGWSLVKILGFGINHSEVFTRKGLSPNVKFPRILGIECVGHIVSSLSPRLKVGQLVISIMGEMGREFDGSYAEYALIPDEQLYPIETNLSTEALVALPETYYTAFGSYKNLRVSESDTVLVRGATSGVGVAFAKLVKARFPNIRLVGSSRSEGKINQLLKVGYDQIILDKNGTLNTRESFSKIQDLIGAKTIKNSILHLREQGIICSSGQLGGQWNLENFDPIVQLKKNVYLTSFYSGNVCQESVQQLLDYVEKYKVRTEPEKVFKLEDIQEAHAYLEGNKSFGKVIVKIE